MENLKITSIEELKKAAQGEVVKLPSFSKDTEFIARLKRPSLLNLIKIGKIPNTLLTAANNLFEGGVQQAVNLIEDEDALSSIFEVMEVICENSFVEPSYKELKDANIELTDEQIMFVFSYTQNGLKDLESFRN